MVKFHMTLIARNTSDFYLIDLIFWTVQLPQKIRYNELKIWNLKYKELRYVYVVLTFWNFKKRFFGFFFGF